MNDKKKRAGAESSGQTTVSHKSSLDVEALRQIVEILEASEVSRLVWRNGREKLYVRRGPPPAAAPPAPIAMGHQPPVQLVSHAPAPVVHAAPAPELKPRPSAPVRAPVTEAPEKKGHLITSPFVGTVYRAPSPDQPTYVEVGTVVKKGQVLCIIEAMKLMNEIESEVAGRVVEVLAQNSTPVEFGQALFRIEPV